MIIKTPKRKQYVTVSNDLAQNSSLSFEARGLLVYLLSHPENWRVLASDVERSGNIGAEKRRRVMAELESAGYLTCHRVQSGKGQWGWESSLHESPVEESQRTSQLGRGARARSAKNRTSGELNFGASELRETYTSHVNHKKKTEGNAPSAAKLAKSKKGLKTTTTKKGTKGGGGLPLSYQKIVVQLAERIAAHCGEPQQYFPDDTMIQRTALALAKRYDFDSSLIDNELDTLFAWAQFGRPSLSEFRESVKLDFLQQ